jgi:hypothetical protein
MPRKAKPTPGEACDAHLTDLQRAHERPPTDVRPTEFEWFAGMMLMAAMRRAYESANYCSSAIAWLEPSRDQLR